MPVASGSITFLGAARFQGYWNASTNAATGSGLDGAVSGPVVDLHRSGSSANGGYAEPTGLTASIGSYWQVTGSGAHDLDGHTNWNLNDWAIYSGSAAGGTGKWTKLAFEDTIASIVVGDISATSLWHLTGSADKHVLFISGAVDSTVVQSGSNNFTYDYETGVLSLAGSISATTGAPAAHQLGGKAALQLGANNTAGDITANQNCDLLALGYSRNEMMYWNASAGELWIMGDQDADAIYDAVKIEADGNLTLTGHLSGTTSKMSANSWVYGDLGVSGSAIVGGNVGIGTTDPGVPLAVHGSDDTSYAVSLGAGRNAGSDLLWLKNTHESAGYAGIYFAVDSTANPEARIALTNEGSKDGDLTFALRSSDNVVERMRIDSSGNVGIGTAAPISALEIQDGLTTVGAILTLGTKEPTVEANDVLGRINFYAPLETGADAISVAASIVAQAESAFGTAVNSTSLRFQTGKSEVATTKMVIDENGHVTPGDDNTQDLGSPLKRWANVYTGDLHLKNDRGDWTILEEEEYLCVVNNKSGKKYKMMLQEIEN